MEKNDLIRVNDYFKIKKNKLDELGVLNSLVNYDVPLYVNPKLLSKCHEEEFLDAESKIINHYKTTIKFLLLTDGKDNYWKALKKHYRFPEPSGVGLGTSLTSTNGRGLTGNIAKNCLLTLKNIVDLGINDPTVYRLLFLVQENVGVDRISDMICRIIYDNLQSYTSRMVDELGIKKYYVENGVKKLKRPNGKQLILLPSSILSEIPDSADGHDIVECACKNEEIKTYLCDYFEKALVNVTDINNSKKEKVKNCIIGNKSLIVDLLEYIKCKPAEAYDYNIDDLALFDRLDSILNMVGNQQHIFKQGLEHISSLQSLAESLLKVFKHCIECLGINEELYSTTNKNKIRREQISHKLFIMVLQTAKIFTNYEYFYESKVGNGQIEFVLTNLKEKVLIEFKLSTNDLVHGYEKQLPEYIKRYQSSYSYYVIINVTSENDINNFYKNKSKSINNCSILEIDGTIKKSPSSM